MMLMDFFAALYTSCADNPSLESQVFWLSGCHKVETVSDGKRIRHSTCGISHMYGWKASPGGLRGRSVSWPVRRGFKDQRGVRPPPALSRTRSSNFPAEISTTVYIIFTNDDAALYPRYRQSHSINLETASPSIHPAASLLAHCIFRSRLLSVRPTYPPASDSRPTSDTKLITRRQLIAQR